ncbi:MAG: hypothetical protein JWL96_4257 [Sphingomonas bacterium]|nr:hypothetical protein [Sphingomonas bacterium]
MTASSHQSGSSVAKRAVWRTPTLTEDKIADVTFNQAASAGSDGFDYNPNYVTYGPS